jgi:hypothetical protein
MPSLSPKDRVSLCLFSFTDGRLCRTPRTGNHPHFCFYHAKKETRAQAAEKLAKDLTYFFSGDYLSACDLNTALGRLIPATIRGEIKPRLARTIAYMFQTLMQSTRFAQHEYINAFGTDGWRDAISTSVNANHDYLYPPDPNAPDSEDESDDESDYKSQDDPELEPDAADPGTEPLASSQPATAPPPTTRPSHSPQRIPLQHKPPNPTTPRRPLHYHRKSDANRARQIANPTPSTSTTTTAYSSTANPGNLRRQT